jgi:hypothetical protein
LTGAAGGAAAFFAASFFAGAGTAFGAATFFAGAGAAFFAGAAAFLLGAGAAFFAAGAAFFGAALLAGFAFLPAAAQPSLPGPQPSLRAQPSSPRSPSPGRSLFRRCVLA